VNHLENMTTGHYIYDVKRKIHKEDILRTGLDLMFQHGYNATGVKQITDAVGIPKGSFYNHFDSKEEFGLEVIKMYCQSGLEMYEEIFLDESKTPKERILDFFNRHIVIYKEYFGFTRGCVMGNFSTEMSDVNQNFQELLDDEFNRCEAIIAHCIQAGKRLGDFSEDVEAAQTAAFMLNSWHGALMRMKSTQNAKPLEDCRDMILKILTM
jgi:TetR/AcrR family transcriptional repressor of nem operon